jgi:ferredoxin-NADP reductase
VKGERAVTTESNWPIYSLKLKSRLKVAERTLEFRFEKPPGMTFKAGQFMDLTLINPPETDAEGNMRGFSINSAPDDPELTFTTRLRDTAFKRVLQTMPLGTSPGHDLTGPIYYIAGPPQMVAGLRMMLNKAGIDDDDIRTEEFTGY